MEKLVEYNGNSIFMLCNVLKIIVLLKSTCNQLLNIPHFTISSFSLSADHESDSDVRVILKLLVNLIIE